MLRRLDGEDGEGGEGGEGVKGGKVSTMGATRHHQP
jgi:hypothetical protein